MGGPRADQAAVRLAEVLAGGPVIVSGMVYGELLAVASPADTMQILQALSIDVDFTMPRAAVERAALAWTRYLAERRWNGGRYDCPHCGAKQPHIRCDTCPAPLSGPRHVLADFLIGGPARVCASQLLTWDRGVYHTYFADLATVHP